MEQFLIQGGQPLRGVIRASGNKNAALKMIPACLLTDQPVILRNVPDIGDVRTTIELMQRLGADVSWIEPGILRVHAANITTQSLDDQLAQRIRASIVYAGPLLARLGRVRLPMPGGDIIGERRLDAHVFAFQRLGAHISLEGGALVMEGTPLRGAPILLHEASVTATENAIMAAVLARGTTTLYNAACEPHVQDLCHMLNSMGAQIEGIGANRLIIQGVAALQGGEARVGADFMEVGSFVGAAVVTGGEVTIQGADPQHLDMVRFTFERLGVTWENQGEDIRVPANQSLAIVPDLGDRIPTIKAQPWPAFPADLMSIALVVATQSVGSILFHDWMYESRFFFTDKLVRMGARITLCDPHRVLVQGPTTLRGQAYITSPDIRAGMAILLAALAARGTTRIYNIRQIDRGYERVEFKLRALGAQIERVVDKEGVQDDEENQEPRPNLT